MRNENFATSFLSAPEKTPAEMVVPLRDKPGKTAKPCAKPMKNAVLYENDVFFFENVSEKNNKTALSEKHTGRSPPAKALLTIGKMQSTMRQVGIVATTIEMVCFESGCLIICQMSFQNTTQMESKVAMCNKMLTNKLSSTPKILEKSTRCPEDDTGKNSVNPCTIPKKNKATKMFIALFYCFL